MTVKNISKVPVEFRWIFLEDSFENDGGIDLGLIPLEKRHFWVQENIKKNKEGGGRRRSALALQARRDSMVQMTNKYGMSDLFDIRPLHGIIGGMEEIDMSFVFRGEENIKVYGTALCEVKGGPDIRLRSMGVQMILIIVFLQTTLILVRP